MQPAPAIGAFTLPRSCAVGTRGDKPLLAIGAHGGDRLVPYAIPRVAVAVGALEGVAGAWADPPGNTQMRQSPRSIVHAPSRVAGWGSGPGEEGKRPCAHFAREDADAPVVVGKCAALILRNFVWDTWAAQKFQAHIIGVGVRGGARRLFWICYPMRPRPGVVTVRILASLRPPWQTLAYLNTLHAHTMKQPITRS